MRIAFLGTPSFALPSLDMLFQAGHTLHVYTQPDKPVGRHGTLTPPPVKEYALTHGIPVSQHARIKSDEGLADLADFAPDLMVTAAFGQILSAANLAVPRQGCINVHGSLLPKYRGAAPIQWAIIHGESITGITTMFTDVGMDTGDILLSDTIAILPDETAGELSERLSVLGAETLRRTLAALENGSLKRIPQNAAEATTVPLLKKEHGKLDFSQPAQAVHNRVRGSNPWPGAYALLDGEPLKIWQTCLCSDAWDASLPCGTLLGDAKTGLFVVCGDGAAELLSVQAPGGKRMDGKTFLRGRSVAGCILQ